MSCPAYDELLSWLAEPAGDQLGDVAQHVRGGCPECRRRLELLDVLARSMGHAPPPTVPAALRTRVLTAFAAADAQSAAAGSTAVPLVGAVERLGRAVGQSLGALREFVAELLEPGPSPALAAGLRGDDDSGLRRYQAGPYLLDVAMVERRSLLGQLTDDEGGEVEDFMGATAVLCGADGAREISIDADGGFRFEQAGPGRYALLVESESLRLVFPDVDLTDAQD